MTLFNQNVADAFGNPDYDRRFSTGVLAPRRIGVRFSMQFWTPAVRQNLDGAGFSWSIR